jgi:hypothetical protein
MGAAPWMGNETLPPAVVERLDGVCDRFEEAWAMATTPQQRPAIETFCAEVPEGERLVLLHRLVACEIRCRRRAG